MMPPPDLTQGAMFSIRVHLSLLDRLRFLWQGHLTIQHDVLTEHKMGRIHTEVYVSLFPIRNGEKLSAEVQMEAPNA